MAENPEQYAARLAAAETQSIEAEWEREIEHRRALRTRQRAPGRDRDAVLAELEAGSDELSAMDNALASQQNGPQKP